MANQAGIWIDRKSAKLFFFSNGKEKFQEIESGIEKKTRFSGEKDPQSFFGGQAVTKEKTQQRRQEKELDEFLVTTCNAISNVDEIVVFGPAETKHALAKMIRESSKLLPKVLAVKKVDSLTDPQLNAWARGFFAELEP